VFFGMCVHVTLAVINVLEEILCKRVGAQKVFLTTSDGAGLGSGHVISSTFHTLSPLV